MQPNRLFDTDAQGRPCLWRSNPLAAGQLRRFGELLEVKPDETRSERIGKVPVHWIAVFAAVHHGKSTMDQLSSALIRAGRA